MKQLIVSLTVGTVLGVAALAAAKEHGVDVKLPNEVKEMYRLVGNWQGKAVMQTGDTRADVGISVRCEPSSLGYAIACKTRFTGIPGGTVEESDLFGWDPGARKYHWFAVSNMGETHDHVADPSSGSTLKFVYDGVTEGKPMRETISLTFAEDGRRIDLRNEGTVGGQPAWLMTGGATKK